MSSNVEKKRRVPFDFDPRCRGFTDLRTVRPIRFCLHITAFDHCRNCCYSGPDSGVRINNQMDHSVPLRGLARRVWARHGAAMGSSVTLFPRQSYAYFRVA